MAPALILCSNNAIFPLLVLTTFEELSLRSRIRLGGIVKGVEREPSAPGEVGERKSPSVSAKDTPSFAFSSLA
jgi:hypothetical protein